MSTTTTNPYSSGGGGNNFENKVQAAFTVLMLTGGRAPCLPAFPIKKIKLQGKYEGYTTDDLLVYVQDPQSGKEFKLLVQIKHEILITGGSEIFTKFIEDAWNDFNNKDFNISTDKIALITGPLSSTDINHVRPILEWARASENANEFIKKIDTYSAPKKEKYQIIEKQLIKASNEPSLSKERIWEFLKSFHLIGYDLDTATGSTLSLIQTLIEKSLAEQNLNMWEKIVCFINDYNENAGTVTIDTLPEDIRSAFDSTFLRNCSEDIKKLRASGDLILDGIKSTIGDIHINRSDYLAELIELTESSNLVIITGERGSGKSSLIKSFCDKVNKEIPVFCLRTEQLEEPHLSNVFSHMNLSGSLEDIANKFSLFPKKYIILESLEKLLELENERAFSDLLQWLNKSAGWTIIASCREHAYQPITFKYLEDFDAKKLLVQNFTDSEIDYLFEKIPCLNNLYKNSKLKELIRNPFFANHAYKAIKKGVQFSNEDDEEVFQSKLWDHVICNTTQQSDGKHRSREEIFIQIAVARARSMHYEISCKNFDQVILHELNKDNLININSKALLVSLAHDVLEDLAIEKYIDHIYHGEKETHQILMTIGNEPAMRRGFRLWLSKNLKYNPGIQDFIISILNEYDIHPYWKDEIITAILQGEHPHHLLELLKQNLLSNNAALLKHFCYILRISCQIPNLSKGSLFFIPYGAGWEAIIIFLYENRSLLPDTFISDSIEVIDA